MRCLGWRAGKMVLVLEPFAEFCNIHITHGGVAKPHTKSGLADVDILVRLVRTRSASR
jgi:hypothetical protein